MNEKKVRGCKFIPWLGPFCAEFACRMPMCVPMWGGCIYLQYTVHCILIASCLSTKTWMI